MIKWEDIETDKTSGQIKVKCPACIDKRTNKRDKSLSVDLDNGLANCHYCSEFSIRDFKEKRIDKSYELPKQEWTNFTNLSDQVVKWFKGRGISQRTLIENNITEERFYQPQLGKEVNNIVFNSFEGDVLINKKYRGANKSFTQSKGTRSIFYGINDVIGQKQVYIVEGEIDKLSFWEIGKRNAISLPNGANDNDKFWQHAEHYLKNVEKFYICTDMDEKGEDVSEKIAQRLGRYRCERVKFKNKDANDDLQEGVTVLEESLSNSKPYPVSGTVQSNDLYDAIFKLYDEGIPKTIFPTSKWLKCLKDSDTFSVMRGHLVTVTGIPSHGKSSFTDWYVLNLVNDLKMKASFFSPEHSPLELYLSKFASLFYGKPFFKSKELYDRINKQEIKDYIKWSNEKIYFTNPEKNQTPTWDWLLETFKEQMYSYGVDVFIIDAFNKVVGASEKNQIDEILTKLTSFAQRNNVIIFLVAHPTKMKKDESGTYEAPDLYSVSGSADFRNQTHDGYTIYRFFEDENNPSYTKFINLKTKFGFQGTIGNSCDLNYNIQSGRYYPKGEHYDNSPLVDFTPKQAIINNETGEVNLTPMAEIEHNYRNGNVFKDNKSNFEKEAKTGYEIPLPEDGDFQAIETEPPF